MSQSADRHRIAKDLSPEELAQYRQRLDQQLQNRKVDEALLQRAWDTAHRIAAMLYEDFDATQVAVFGSLAEQNWFSKWSDIDIAIWGIPPEKYFYAVSAVSDISGLFKVDLVDFKKCKGLFRERIQSQLIPIEKGVIYKVDRRALIERIVDERKKIEGTIKEIAIELQKIEEAPIQYRRNIEFTIARYIVDFYNGMENIFRRIALDIDLNIPDGRQSHKDLLVQMAEPRKERPPVISSKNVVILDTFLRFRHVSTHIYGYELDYEQTEILAKQVGELFSCLADELDAFIANLEKQDND
jgi:predicted nucleotidyltransferase